MAINLYGKSFLSLLDFSSEEIHYLLDLAHKLKRQKSIPTNLLQGKNVALFFEKPSIRTRCAFDIALASEGGHTTYIDIESSHFSKKESVKDSAKVLAGFYHAIEFRGFKQKTVTDLAKYSNIPVYNGLTDEEHPTQILAALMTIQEVLPNQPLAKTKVVFVGDTRNNLAHAWIYAASILGMHFVLYGPKELHPDPTIISIALENARKSGAVIEVSDNITCLKDADAIYTDAWVSMGEESKLLDRVNLLKNYQVTMEMLAKTNNNDVLFMHCLPALHDREIEFVKDAWEKYGVDITEVTDEVFESKHSIAFEESANRLHSIKAIMVATLNKSINSEIIKNWKE